jgi:LmbE family N-acetylglucosaminyl deacetylase
VTSIKKLPLLGRLRRAVVTRFLVSMRRATHRMPSGLRTIDPSRVLVVAPHMDDEVIPCGGTLMLHQQQGSEVHVVFVTDSGGPSQNPQTRSKLINKRTEEMRAAKEVVGYHHVEVLGFPDGTLVKHEHDVTNRLRELIADQRPDVIFCPFPADGHSDHQTVALAASAAAQRASFRGEIWAYEVWTAIWPNVAVDITLVAEAKELAIRKYASQIFDRDYAAATLGLNRYRGLPHRVEFAEAFYVCSAPDYARLAAKLNGM